jgi:glycosyltransferase involved in cell wall biosynthesis
MTQSKTGKRVLLLARTLDAGGIERDVSKYARHLRDFGFETYAAVFRAGGMRYEEIIGAGIPVLDLNLTSFRSRSCLEAAQKLRSWVKQNGIQILHAFDVPASIWAVLLKRRIGVPLTISSQLCYRHLSPRSHRVLLPVIDRRADAVFVNCEAIKRHLVQDWKVAASKVLVCHNGFEEEEFRARHAATRDCVVIGTVALLRAEKNLSLLIRAFAKVHRTFPDTRLLIVGEGELRQSLECMAADLQLNGVFSLPGATSRVADSLQDMDVFVLPSCSEAFSNSLLEAMASGCCCVASDVGGTAELIQNGETGLLFASNNEQQLVDALIRTVGDKPLRTRLSERASSFVHKNLTVSVATQKLAALYTDLLSREATS